MKRFRVERFQPMREGMMRGLRSTLIPTPASVACFAALAVVLALAGTARAELAGLEDSGEISVECDSNYAEKPKPEDVEGFKVCRFDGWPCKVSRKGGQLLFDANVTVYCMAESATCSEIESCAGKKLSGAVADAVRRRNDPNNQQKPDGSVNPIKGVDASTANGITAKAKKQTP